MDLPEDGPAGGTPPSTTVINAANVAAMFGTYKESVDESVDTDSAVSARDQLAMLTAMGAGVEAIAAAQRDEGVFFTPEHRVGAVILSVLDEHASDRAVVVPSAIDGQEAIFDEDDWAGWARESGKDWLWTKVQKVLKLVDDRAKFEPGPTEPQAIAENARVAILGDWGTNLYGAPHCAASIRDDLHPPQAIIHLGDVYYTGTRKAIEERFLGPWPKVANAWNRACNSNHEMLGDGGRPYRDVTLRAFHQSSPMWWLANSKWSLIGIDTAYTEGTMDAEQVEWFTNVLQRSRESGRRPIAFSHHMPWRTDKLTLVNKLIEPLTNILEEHLLDGWYFGHEHLCSLFERHPKWGLYGACIGHSGYPYWAVSTAGREEYRRNSDGSSWWRRDGNGDVPASYLLSGKNRFIPGYEDRYGPNGYAMLDLGDGEWTETICEPEGAPIGVRTLSPVQASAGELVKS
jgi:hypothetical protein